MVPITIYKNLFLRQVSLVGKGTEYENHTNTSIKKNKSNPSKSSILILLIF